MYVTYARDPKASFNRNYWINVHLPLVRTSWEPFGLLSVAGFFPAEEDADFIAICPCIFRDEAAMTSALAAQETKRVMEDVKNVTDIEPQHSLAKPM